MTNAFAVCLLSLAFFCCTSLTSARQVPKECAKGPEYWCISLKNAASCGAVGHCIGSVWEQQNEEIVANDVSDKFVHFFRQLKDVNKLVDYDYIGARLSSECRDVAYPEIAKLCKDNTDSLEQYIGHLLLSDATPETMCRIIGMCNSVKVNKIANPSKKKAPEPTKKPVLLGGSRCTWGPSYWCSNFSTGHECRATHHCVERVWSTREYPRDDDGICKICKDMVTQARDQLQSNETQEELKEVFEGQCKLIPIKIVRKECMKLADDFVPELVETLSSEMNPDAVCSVAGLCNNARIDRLIEEYNATLKLREDCFNCKKSVGIVRKRFDETSYEDFLQGLLQVCQNMDSLSDSCSMLVFKYFENILSFVKKDFTAKSVCHVSGQCSHQFHSHNLYSFPDESLDGLKASDDVPCEFCEQVVRHMRDTLVANTSEVEFHKVLTGLCKQTGKFKTECLSLVEQYHSRVYYFLVSDLKPDAICALIGICKARVDAPIAPLLPMELAIKAITQSPVLIGADEANSYKNKAREEPPRKQANVQVLGPLPLERMFVSAPRDSAVCSFCEYFLHYLQVALSDDNTEEAIKKAVENACEVLPNEVDSQCREFVTEYGPAVIALLVQEIDPASVCPALGLCAQVAGTEVRHVAINAGKSNCPLCLFAVTQLETVLQNNRSVDNIRKALDGLCVHLSAKLRTECVDFVDSYTNQLIQMLVADMNAQEICVFLKLCSPERGASDPLRLAPVDKFHEKPHLRGDRNNIKKPMLPSYMLEEQPDIDTNEIPDNTVNGRPVKKVTQKTVCVICQFVLKEIDDQIKDKHNDDEIKKVVHGVCKSMPKSIRADCDQFVEKYSDLVISLLLQELNPDEVCRELKLCDPTAFSDVREEILDCAVCETVVMAVKKVLNNDKVDRNIVHIVEKSCALLPAKYSDRCHTMLEIYGESVIHLIEDLGTKGVCQKIGLCTQNNGAYVRMFTEKH